MSFETDKAAALALIRAAGCTDVSRVDEHAASYEDLLPLLREFAKTFDCNPTYLVAILSIFDDDLLLQYGIYLNKTIDTADDANWIIGGTIGTVTLSGAPGKVYQRSLEIHGDAVVGSITVSGNLRLGDLAISSGATVTTLTVEEGSVIETLYLKNCGTHHGTLQELTEGAAIEGFLRDELAVFGKIICPPPIILL